jgi:hypothetical protein
VPGREGEEILGVDLVGEKQGATNGKAWKGVTGWVGLVYLVYLEWLRLPFPARIERPLPHRGGSASKKGTRLLLPFFQARLFSPQGQPG